MARRDSIRLKFERDSSGSLVLTGTEMQPDVGGVVVATANRPGEPGDFDWSIEKGKLRIFVLALIRASRYQPQGEEKLPDNIRLLAAERVSSETRKCTETVFYDLTASKSCDWLAAILSPTRDWGEAKLRFCRWFKFHNMRGKDSSGMPIVELNAENLAPGDIEVVLDGEVVDAGTCDDIEKVLAAYMGCGFPPYFEGKVRCAGFMPSVGPGFGNREDELGRLNTIYGTPEATGVQVVAKSGFGKTALVRWWLRAMLREDRLREALLFSWSFPRQSRTDSTLQSLKSFFRALGDSIDVELEDGLLVQEVAERLTAGLRRRPTVFFLDGLETLLNERADYSTGSEENRQADAGEEAALQYDSLVHLLKSILTPGARIAFLVVTTREPVGKVLGVGAPVFETLEIECYPGFEYADEEMEREATAALRAEDDEVRIRLEDDLKRINKSRDRHEDLLARPMGVRGADVNNRLRYDVRKKLEEFGSGPECCFLYVASCFDEPADWDALMHVLRGADGRSEVSAKVKAHRDRDKSQLTGKWAGMSDEDWSDIRVKLVGRKLLLPSGDGVVEFHASTQRCIYDDFRQHMPGPCSDVHHRLSVYFASDPHVKALPEGIEEMEPLFRASWHGCNSGDFQETFQKIAYERMSRGWQAYVIFHLAEYEESLQILNLFTEDGETFPASDLHEDARVIVVHGIALCHRYLDRLDEAYRRERIAWRASKSRASHPQLGPIAANLLRLHHIFGDIGKEVTPVLWSLLRGALPNLRASTVKDDVPLSMLHQAAGYLSGIAALIQACRGKQRSSQRILSGTERICKLLGFKKRPLFPGMGVIHHSLALLELGEWQRVLDGDQAKQFDSPLARYVQTGAISYVRGRALAMSSASPGVQAKALLLIEDCIRKAERRFDWWHALAMLEVGRIQMKLALMVDARAAFEAAIELARSRKDPFKLIEIDSLLGIAALEATLHREEASRSAAEKAVERIEKCGYEARRQEAQRFLML